MFWVAQERKTATELIDVRREQLLNRELAARISAGPEGRSAGASLRTLWFVLASAILIRVLWQQAPAMMKLKGEAKVGDWQFKWDYQHDTQPK